MERPTERDVVERLRARLGARRLDDAIRRELEAMLAEADPDAALAAAIRDSGRVKEPFRIGLGGEHRHMVVGNLGSEQLFDYTVIGDEVNLGARLESLNKDYQTHKHIFISDGTYEAAGAALEVRHLGELKVKGKTRPFVVYELLLLAGS